MPVAATSELGDEDEEDKEAGDYSEADGGF